MSTLIMNRTDFVIYIKIYSFRILENNPEDKNYLGILFFKEEPLLDGLELKSIKLEPDFGLSIESNEDPILLCNLDAFYNEITLYKYKTSEGDIHLTIKNQDDTKSKNSDPSTLN